MCLQFIALLAALPLLRAEAPPSFTGDVLPIFDKNCSGCHAANVKMGSLDLDTYSGILKGGNNGAILVPGKSAESRLYLMIARKIEPGMPLGGKPLGAAEIETIRRWIDAGAPAKPPQRSVGTGSSGSGTSRQERKPVKILSVSGEPR